MTFNVLTLEGSRNRYTRTFSTIWVPINFYFFRRIQQNCNLWNWRHLHAIFLTILMMIIFLFCPISANSISTAKIWRKNIFFSKLIQMLSDSKKETQECSGTKFEQNRLIIHHFHHKKAISFLTTPSESGLNSKSSTHQKFRSGSPERGFWAYFWPAIPFSVEEE